MLPKSVPDATTEGQVSHSLHSTPTSSSSSPLLRSRLINNRWAPPSLHQLSLPSSNESGNKLPLLDITRYVMRESMPSSLLQEGSRSTRSGLASPTGEMQATEIYRVEQEGPVLVEKRETKTAVRETPQEVGVPPKQTAAVEETTPMQRASTPPYYGATEASCRPALVDAVQLTPSYFVLRLTVSGMTCSSCAARIEAALVLLPTVERCTVSFTTSSATLWMSKEKLKNDSKEACEADVKRTVEGLGYRITSMLREEEGEGNSGEFNDTAASGAFKAAQIEALSYSSEIENLRYHCLWSIVWSLPFVLLMIYMMWDSWRQQRSLADPSASPSSANMSFSFGTMFWINVVEFICATPLVLIHGRFFFIRAVKLACTASFSMDTLVAIGTGVAYFYSKAVVVGVALASLHATGSLPSLTADTSTASFPPTYFETAALLITFMLIGRCAETYAKSHTNSAVLGLMKMIPDEVKIEIEERRPGHQLQEDWLEPPTGPSRTTVLVPFHQLQVGANVVIYAGERVPVDGIVLTGLSDVEEQLITGESLPRAVSPGDAVVSGSMNLNGALVVRAEKVGKSTTLSQILAVLTAAQQTKSPVQRLADRLASWFVPFVLLWSLTTLCMWLVLGYYHVYPTSWLPANTPPWVFAFQLFVASVVAACPCALGLATPTAISVGTGVGAQIGVLVQSPNTLESVAHASCVIFDKTGTLTMGTLSVVEIQEVPLPPLHRSTASAGAMTCSPLLILKAVARQSVHPIARALAALEAPKAEEAAAHDADVRQVISHHGEGLEGEVAVVVAHTNTDASCDSTAICHVWVGNEKLVQRSGAAPLGSAAAESFIDAHQQEGHTIVFGVCDGFIRYLFALADAPKPEAAAVVRVLHHAGLRTLLVSGDHPSAALAVAKAVGIDAENVYASQLPQEKVKLVQLAQEVEHAKGRTVVFVGDGLNDAPALIQADAGVALGAGAEVAIDAADAVLLRSSLVTLLHLRDLSIITVRRVYGNFFWALVYNMCTLPLASGMLLPILGYRLPPLLAGLAMIASSLCVLLSSLSIRFFKAKAIEEY